MTVGRGSYRGVRGFIHLAGRVIVTHGIEDDLNWHNPIGRELVNDSPCALIRRAFLATSSRTCAAVH